MTQDLADRDDVVGAIQLPPEPASARVARRFVAEVLREVTTPAAIDVIVLLTNELVTNAVVHAGTSFDVLVSDFHGCVQIEVSDAEKQPPVLVDGVLVCESGRGLRIVAALSETWGTSPTEGGKAVWFRCKA